MTRLEQCRKRAGMSKYRLAKESGVSVPTTRSIRRTRTNAPASAPGAASLDFRPARQFAAQVQLA
jgi:transcriptional regulator with XRE-family HTH domain